MAQLLEDDEAPEAVASVAEEFVAAQLGNVSRTRRLCWLAELMSLGPSRSFPEAAGNDSELEAIYRFLGNPHIAYSDILEPHYVQTAERISVVPRVLILHDTTDCAYAGEGRRGLGRLAGANDGFLAHTSLAVTGDSSHRPLGVMGLSCWARTDPPLGKKSSQGRKLSGADYAKREDKESARWIEGVDLVAQRIGAHPRLIHVTDREGDNYAFLEAMQSGGHRFVVRLTYDRVVSAEQVVGKTDKLRDVLLSQPVVATRPVVLSRRQGSTKPRALKTFRPREQREAQLQIRAGQVRMQKPKYLGPSVSPWLSVNVVYVTEIDPPPNAEPVEWMLATTEAIDTAEDILCVVDDYRARWIIEEFFKALKTGCGIEKRQLESYESLTNALAVFVPIAWQLLLLRDLSRTQPEAPATEVLNATQIHVLQTFVPQAKLTATCTVRQALLAVAALGGHIKNNGDPGWLILGRGFEKLLLLESGWNARANLNDGKKLDQS
jgi:Transposase DNA-binding/Transposase DDE domain